MTLEIFYGNAYDINKCVKDRLSIVRRDNDILRNIT